MARETRPLCHLMSCIVSFVRTSSQLYTTPFVYALSQLSKQRRQQLKDRFKGFNVEFEELHRVQEQWSLPDPQLRARVRNNNVEVIVPLYNEFFRM